MRAPDGAPPTVREWLGRCGPEHELVCWWQRDRPRDPHEALWVITFRRATQTFSVTSFPVVVSHWSHQIYGSDLDAAGMALALADGLWDAPEAARTAVLAMLRH